MRKARRAEGNSEGIFFRRVIFFSHLRGNEIIVERIFGSTRSLDFSASYKFALAALFIVFIKVLGKD